MKGLIEGRIVHYVNQMGVHMAAIVTKVWNDQGCCNLFVFLAGIATADEGCPKTSINFDETMAKGTWHWVEQA